MIWVALLLAFLLGGFLGAMAMAILVVGARRDRCGYLPPEAFRGLEAQEFRPPYTGER